MAGNAGWVCRTCETLNGVSTLVCEVCDRERGEAPASHLPDAPKDTPLVKPAPFPAELKVFATVAALFVVLFLFFSKGPAVPAANTAEPPASSTAAQATAQTADQARRAEAIRIAERTRVEQGIAGEWHYSNGPSGRLTSFTITKDGDTFSAEYPCDTGHLVVPQVMRGVILGDNQLKLVNVTQSGKLVRPGWYCTGDFSQEAWIELSGDGRFLTIRFSQAEGGRSLMMNRTAGKVTEPPAQEASAPDSGSSDLPLPISTSSPAAAVPATSIPDASRIVRVLSEPSGAQIYLGQRLLGSTPLDVSFPSNAVRSRQVLSATLQGFERVQTDFVPASLDSAEVLIRLTAISGQLRVLSQYDVTVVIDNQTFGPGQRVDAAVSPGTYRTRLTAPDVLFDTIRSVTIRAGGVTELEMPRAVALRIIARPSNCEIFVDGRPYGSAPVTVTAVEGIHSFVLTWPTGPRVTKEINMQQGLARLVITQE